jgi:hypothetical protein
MTSLGGCFHEHDPHLCGLCCGFFQCYLSIELGDKKRYLRSVVEISYRLSDKSALLPTNTIMTSFPRSDRTSSIHFVVDKKDWRSKWIEIWECGRREMSILRTCDIEDDNSHGRISNVRGY